MLIRLLSVRTQDSINVPVEYRFAVVGIGGKTIAQLSKQSGCSIHVRTLFIPRETEGYVVELDVMRKTL